MKTYKNILRRIVLNIIFIFCLALSPLKAQTNTSKTTVIGWDKSYKIESERVLKKLEKKLHEILWKTCKNSGDKVIVSYIYENSGSSTNKTEYVLKLPELNLKGLSPYKQKNVKRQYKALVQKKRIAFIKQISNEIMTHNEERPQTKILEWFAMLNQLQKKYKKLDVFIISDMQEWSSMRKLKKTVFSSVPHAQKIGKSDGKKIQQKFGLDNHFLKDIQIQIFYPVEDLENEKIYTWIPYYWNTVFSTFGANQTNINYLKI